MTGKELFTYLYIHYATTKVEKNDLSNLPPKTWFKKKTTHFLLDNESNMCLKNSENYERINNTWSPTRHILCVFSIIYEYTFFVIENTLPIAILILPLFPF